MTNNSYLQNRLETAIANRQAIIASMESDYSQDKINQLAAANAAIQEAQAELDRQAAADARAAAVAVQTTTTTTISSGTAPRTAIISLMAGGKGDRRVEVPVGTSLRQILNELNWDATGHTFKRRVGPGQTADLTQGLDHTFQAGEYEVMMVPAVRGGC